MLGVKEAVVAVVSLYSTLAHATPQEVYHSNAVQSDSYFYGQSPPVYPTPEMSGTAGWEETLSKAQAFVAMMSFAEKVNLTGGYEDNTSSCSGRIRAIPRLGFPGMCMQDGPAGVKGAEGVNGYPAGVHIGTSWNKTNAYNRAKAMAGEFKRKGATMSLGPAVLGPLGRVPVGGRNFEGFGVDPYLSGILGAQSVRATQDEGIISCTKHFVGNEQETHRFVNRDPVSNHSIEALSSNIDDKTMHEVYMWPFADAIHAGAPSIMCSYQRVNNSYGCQNSKAMNGLLKTELGFQGFVISDWEAQKSGIASALAGLDMTMPLGETYWGSQLIQAVHNGSIPESHLDDMVTRIMVAWYYSRQDDSDLPPVGVGLPPDLLGPHEFVDARDHNDANILIDAAIEGHVLVKNIKQALPLSQPRMVAIYGYDAKAPGRNNPENGFSDWMLGTEAGDWHQVECGMYSDQSPCRPFVPFVNGTLIGGGGSGAIAPFYVDSPREALQARAKQDGTQVFWDVETANSNSTVPGATDACLVFINSFSTEAVDRVGLRDDYSDALVLNIAAQCKNTIVVVHSAGIRLVDRWIEHPNVTATIMAHLPGQDTGEAITRILYGDVSPSGKLTYTIARNESDYGSLLEPVSALGSQEWDRYFPQSNFTEGPYIDYRAFDKASIDPRFEFGFGLTYTTFEYDNLIIQPTASNLSTFPTGPIIPGGHADLWDPIVVVTADVTNTGEVEAAEISQLYVTIPEGDQPSRQLRGFEKALILPGETKTFEFQLRRRDLSVWDVVAQQWRLLTGSKYRVFVGASSRQLALNGKLVL